MRREPKYMASFFLSAALMAPVGALALPWPQDDREGHEQEERECRVYRCTKDYHNWDAREDEAYQSWLESKHASLWTRIDSTTSARKVLEMAS